MAGGLNPGGGIDLQFVTVETFIIQACILFLVFWVLNKFIFKPYLIHLDEWEEKQEKVRADYENAERIIQEKTQQGEEILEKARQQGNEIIQEAEVLAQSKKDKIILDAESDAESFKKNAREEIDRERKTMLSGVKDQILGLTLRLNEKLFGEKKASKEFLDKHMDSL